MSRKRKFGARGKSGRLLARPTEIDRGTIENQARRSWLAGTKGDMNLTTYPLGILLANEAITEDQHRAGCRFAWLFSRIYGRPSVTAVAYGEPRGGEGDEDAAQVVRCKDELEAIEARLRGLSRQHRDVLVNLVVYERIPKWMRPVIPSFADVREAQMFQKTIAELEQAMGYRGRRAA